MAHDLTEDEEELVSYAREKIVEHAQKRWEEGLYDVLYAFVLSDNGGIYAGKPFESNQPSFNVCAERHAINQMQYEESEQATVEAILVAGPVPDEDHPETMPCGACRHAINEFGDKDTTVIVSSFVRERKGEWTMFPKIRVFTARELYPESYKPVEWD